MIGPNVCWHHKREKWGWLAASPSFDVCIHLVCCVPIPDSPPVEARAARSDKRFLLFDFLFFS